MAIPRVLDWSNMPLQELGVVVGIYWLSEVKF
jgi:hypothetical protein